ncbi:uncharacterized protein [Antedon mediterranea]|uniref:uncharacterized protein n=1 Tax=Antedon mediterranea TaxID=105859 RepID=UPI003AF7946A
MNVNKIIVFIGFLLALAYDVNGANPTVDDWSLNTETCRFRMRFGARFTIPYTNSTGAAVTTEQDLPKGRSAEGVCTDTRVEFNLKYFFNSLDANTYYWAYTLEFEKINNDEYFLKKVTVRYIIDSRFKNPAETEGTVVIETTQDVQPKAKLGTHLAADEVMFYVGTSRIGVLMTDVQLQPFESSVEGGGYGPATEFEYDPNSSNMVSPSGLFLLTSLLLTILTLPY